MTTAREEILARIAQAHRTAPPPDLDYPAITRQYRTQSDLDHEALIDRLIDRLIDYKALVRQTTPAGLPQAVAAALTERSIRRVVIPDGVKEDWLSESAVHAQVDWADSPMPVQDLDDVDGVVTGCTVAVAETGTLILDGRSGQGRRVVSLIPDYHLCVVMPETVVADIPQALVRLDPTRPITMISGPSATSDIELNRVEGVHGPRTLEVIVVTPDAPDAPTT